jgi:hypothetical protein
MQRFDGESYYTALRKIVVCYTTTGHPKSKILNPPVHSFVTNRLRDYRYLPRLQLTILFIELHNDNNSLRVREWRSLIVRYIAILSAIQLGSSWSDILAPSLIAQFNFQCRPSIKFFDPSLHIVLRQGVFVQFKLTLWWTKNDELILRPFLSCHLV